MKYFIDSCFWVAGRFFALFIVCGVLGGIFADIPGVSDDPSGRAAIGFIARCFKWALTTFREYPVGVALFFFVSVVFRMAVIYPHVEMMKREIADRKSQKKLPSRGKRARNKRKAKGKK